MPFYPRHSFVCKGIPKLLPRVLGETHQTPFLRLILFYRLDISIESDFQLGFAGANSRRNNYLVVPDNRTGMCQARNSTLPLYVLFIFDIPVDREHLRGIDATSTRPSKLRPILTAPNNGAAE